MTRTTMLTTTWLSLVAAMTLAPAVAMSQSASSTQPTSTNPPADAETVIVTGYRLQNRLAVDAKRVENRVAEFLTSDEIGQQPDYNISDSFRRVPGVTTIFDEDEGRYVALRALEPNFTLGSLDGSTLATGERGNRQLNMEAIPTTAVRRLEIFKSRTPDAEGNAIGGTVNLVTRSAFDHKGLYYVGSVFVGTGDSQAAPGKGYNRESDDGLNFRFDGTVSNTFGPGDQFGVMATLAFSRKRRDQERYSPGAFALFNNVPVSSSHLWQGYPNTVDRYGGTVKLEWRPNDTFKTHVSGTYYIQADNELRLSHQLTRGTVDLARTSGTSARVSTAGGFVRFNDFPIDKPLTAVQAGFEWQPTNRQTISGRLAYSEAAFNEPSNQLQFNLPTSAANAYTVELNDKLPRVTLDSTATFLNPTAYTFGSYFTYEDDSDDFIKEGQIDWSFNTERQSEGWGFGLGAKLRENERDFDRTLVNYALGTGVSLTLANFLLADQYRPIYAGQDALFIDFDKFQAYRAANPNAIVANATTSAFDSLRNDYVVTEQVQAAYALARHAGENHALVFGLRHEATETEVAGRRVVGTTTIPLVRSGEYDNLLPSVTLSYNLNQQTKLKFGLFEAIGRPNPSDLGNNEVLNAGNATLTRGNADLLPRKAKNLDLAVEYYFDKRQGLLSLGLFQKSITDNIFSVTLGTTVIDGVTYTITQPRNTGDARISGLEVNFIRNNLDFLPSLFKNFGVSANATFVSSEATLANGAKIDQLNQMPNEQANFAVFYEADAFRARLTYAYVGERLTGITPANFAQNRYDEPYNQLDAQVRFKVGRFDVIGEVRNLTDEHRVNYSSLGGMDYNFFGRQFWLGVALKR